VELLTWCEECEEFKLDVMYRMDPYNADVHDHIIMKNMCSECHQSASEDI